DAQTITVGNLSSALVVRLESGTAPSPTSIEWSVSGPGTLTTPTTTMDVSGNSSNTVTATGPGVISVTASWISSLRAFPIQSVVFNLNATAAAPILSPVSSNPIVTTVGTPFNAVVRLTDASSIPMVGADIKFSSITGVNSTPVIITTDTNGEADSGAIFTAQVAALLNNVVIAEYDPTPLAPGSGDEVFFRFNVNASAPVARTITVAPTTAEVYSGSGSYSIVFTTLDNGVPTGGITVNVGAGGDASVTPGSCVTDGSGTCSVNVDPSGIAFPGSGTITGTRADDASAFASHTVSVAQPTMTSVAGDGASGDVGVAVILSAEVLDGFVGNAPVVAGAVSWVILSDTAGSSLSLASSNTNSSGIASNTLTLGTAAGGVLVRASYNYGSGSVSTDFSVTINTVRTLLIHDGDGQTTPAGLPFPVNVVVEALNDGLSAPDGTQIQYSIGASSTATGSLLSCCGTTSGGYSGVGVIAGTTQGNLVIRAERVDNPAAFVLFNLTVTPPVLQSIAVTPATPTIAFNGSQTFVATGTYSDASTVDISASVTWNSSNPALATMTGATANGAGSFTGGAT
ncbi:MAG: Ig-like domain-containing protein, partial [Arenimonas sp.]